MKHLAKPCSLFICYGAENGLRDVEIQIGWTSFFLKCSKKTEVEMGHGMPCNVTLSHGLVGC